MPFRLRHDATFFIVMCLLVGARCQSLLQLRRGSTILPPYMLNLYNRLKEDRVIPHGSSNTIRSFLPVPGNLGERKILVFNLTGVHRSEYIEKCDLHLRWNKEHSSAGRYWKPKKLRLLMLNLNHVSRPEIQISPVTRGANWGGWQTVDVTDAVISCLEDDDEDNYLLGLAIDQDKGEKPENEEIENFFSSSFLVIFSEDDDHLTIGDIRNKSSESFLSRVKRDNQLTDNHLKIIHGDGPELKSRMKHTQLESVANSKRAKNRKKKRRENRRKERRSMELKWRRSWWKSSPQAGDEGDDDETSVRNTNYPVCERKNWMVDFAKIGWSDWIIAPKKFDAYMCAGDCSYSLVQDMQLSNYATLQAILIRASEGSQTQLCCVPHAMSAVPLLFYDQNKNVVLKKFPSMRVDSCSCR